jgi:hypothetical protein
MHQSTRCFLFSFFIFQVLISFFFNKILHVLEEYFVNEKKKRIVDAESIVVLGFIKFCLHMLVNNWGLF